MCHSGPVSIRSSTLFLTNHGSANRSPDLAVSRDYILVLVATSMAPECQRRWSQLNCSLTTTLYLIPADKRTACFQWWGGRGEAGKGGKVLCSQNHRYDTGWHVKGWNEGWSEGLCCALWNLQVVWKGSLRKWKNRDRRKKGRGQKERGRRGKPRTKSKRQK